MGSDGKLESITLIGARRGQGRGSKFDWVPIPGDRFVVMGKTIHSINVEYWLVEQTPDLSALEAAEAPPLETGPASPSDAPETLSEEP
jgi:hypothetical protein